MRRSGRLASSLVSSAAVLAALLAIPAAAPAGAGSATAPAYAAAVTGGASSLTAAQALDRLKGLAGTWEGTVEGPEGGKATIVYRVISGGSVVLETLFPGSDHEMISAYSVERGELRMVHYCALGNQPRFRLDRAASTPDELRFVFDGGAGFDPKTDAHIHGGRITLKGADAIEATWEYYRAGKPQGAHAMNLARTAVAAAATPMR